MGSGDLQTRRSICQPSRKTFSFLNYVSINSFQSYSLSPFILFVFLFLWLKYNGHKISMNFFALFHFQIGFSLNTSFRLQILLVLLSSDVEINPGPKRTPKAILSICHWNLNSISAHNYVKLSLLRAYLAFHQFGVICLSETYLNSNVVVASGLHPSPHRNCHHQILFKKFNLQIYHPPAYPRKI